VRFADELAVHEIPAFVIAAAKANYCAFALQIRFRQFDVRTINR
jgi:hypothetical protein